ncbi:hypothetical protein E6O75_ATG07295 [Venturia nashicola]|uniref:Uncharacterized protein n=1 Tax=Venturia nashicola TaxID=86259 RepID=A0A4Z1NTS1_9PEZI|nr:hypothetical protein E6O75_ATG07295 [Venturia nashicola]
MASQHGNMASDSGSLEPLAGRAGIYNVQPLRQCLHCMVHNSQVCTSFRSTVVIVIRRNGFPNEKQSYSQFDQFSVTMNIMFSQIRHQADKNTGLSAYSWMLRHGNTKLGLYDSVSVSSECATNIAKDVSLLKCSWKLSVTLKLMREQFNGLFCGRPSGSKAASRHSSLWTHSVIGDDFS